MTSLQPVVTVRIRVGIAHVPEHDLDLAQDRGLQRLEPAPRSEGIVQHECANRRAAPHQRLHDVRADESFGAGDENASGLEIGHA